MRRDALQLLFAVWRPLPPLGGREQAEAGVVAQRLDCHAKAPGDLPDGEQRFVHAP
jgi:hypothetical protein